MIKFFRKIRQGLLAQNRVGKYFTYAIGEIVLVVIGILIALSINNWNEKRKASLQESELLENLHDDINYNLDRIEVVYKEDAIQIERNKRLLKVLLDPNSNYDDSLQIYFGSISRYDVFSPRKTAYEAIQSKGVELIKNKELRSNITQLYDETYMLNQLVLELKKDIHVSSLPLFNDRFLTLENVMYKIPTDFEHLKRDQKFINTLSYITAESRNFLSHHKNMQTQTEAVRSEILEEITKE